MKFQKTKLEEYRRSITGKSFSNKHVKCYWCGNTLNKTNNREICVGDDFMTYCLNCAKKGNTITGKIK